MLKVVKIHIIAINLLALLTMGCSDSKSDQVKQSVPAISAIEIKEAGFTSHLDYPATIKGIVEVDIRPKVEGYIEKVWVEEGAQVKKGQILFTIDVPQLQNATLIVKEDIAKLKSEVADAQLKLSSLRPLVEQKIISENQLESASYQLSAKQAMLKQATRKLQSTIDDKNYLNILAPMNGQIGLIPFREGALVSSTTLEPLTKVVDVSKVYAYYSMSENDYRHFVKQNNSESKTVFLKKSHPVKLLSDNEEYVVEGKIDALNDIVHSSTGSVTFRAIFDNPENMLKAGGSAVIRMSTNKPNGILIPQTAVQQIMNKYFVYKLDKNNRIFLREIKVDHHPDGKNFIVTSGLSKGDIMTIGSTMMMKDSMEVKPVMKNMPINSTN